MVSQRHGTPEGSIRFQVMEHFVEALLTGAGMLWKALWALIFGYLISAGIQVIVTREQMASTLGSRGLRQMGLAGLFGFISSSCSFAALAASRSVLVKGAHPANAQSFLIASTNLVIELGIVLWVLVGWRFTLANFILGLLMLVFAYLISWVWHPAGLAEAAKTHAKAAQEAEVGGPVPELAKMTWREKLSTRLGWQAIAGAFVGEWRMVWKELLFGFTIAGFIAVFVPQPFWNAIFLISADNGIERYPDFWSVMQNALVAPVVAFFTFIGSMGNVPLAAMLWSKGVSFGGMMSFLGADLVAATVVWVHVKYYGWRYAFYLSVLLYISMVLAGVATHYLFAAAGQIPAARPELNEMVRFAVDHTLFMNIAFGVVAVALVWLWMSTERHQTSHQH